MAVEPTETEGDDGEMEHEQREEKSEIQRQKAERERGGVSERKATIERESAFSMPREV